jgi:hypothetical protein
VGVKRTVIWMVVGAIVAVVLTTWLAPTALAWWFRPPAGQSMILNADEAVHWGMNQLIRAQLIALVGGALLGLLVGILTRPRKHAPPAAAATPAPQKT